MSKPLCTRIVAAFVLLCVTSIFAATPKVIEYQGRLIDASGNPVTDGNYTVTFRIFNIPSGGSELWSEPNVSVTATDGLFTTTLGSPTAFPYNDFAIEPSDIFSTEDSLWLEIQVGAEKLTPRIPLKSVPYSLVSQDVNSHSSYDADIKLQTNSLWGILTTFGNDGEKRIELAGNNYGEISIFDAGPTISSGTSNGERTVQLTSGFNSGGALYLYNGNGSFAMGLDAGWTGDQSAQLRTNAINEEELLNEPGIAVNYNTGGTVLDAEPSASTDILSVTITIPTDGYIMVEGTATLVLQGVNNVFAYVQVTETSAAPFNGSTYVWVNAVGYANTNSAYTYETAEVKNFYYKSAGTYTFYLQGDEYVLNDVTAAVNTSGSQWLTATFYPTSYGAVTVPVARADNNSDATAMQVNVNSDPSKSATQTVYTADLRQLELKAKEARLKATEAELELEKARNATMPKASGSSMTSGIER